MQDINKYLGSGTYWKNHCKKHGGYTRDNITTLYSKMFENKDDAQQYLDKFTKENIDYWKEHNTTWANLCEENTEDCVFTGGEIQRAVNAKRVKDGTHHLLGGEIQRQLVKDGTHHLLNPPTHICPHCNKVGKGGAMFRFHFDNCKLK